MKDGESVVVFDSYFKSVESIVVCLSSKSVDIEHSRLGLMSKPSVISNQLTVKDEESVVVFGPSL